MHYIDALKHIYSFTCQNTSIFFTICVKRKLPKIFMYKCLIQHFVFILFLMKGNIGNKYQVYKYIIQYKFIDITYGIIK